MKLEEAIQLQQSYFQQLYQKRDTLAIDEEVAGMIQYFKEERESLQEKKKEILRKVHLEERANLVLRPFSFTFGSELREATFLEEVTSIDQWERSIFSMEQYLAESLTLAPPSVQIDLLALSLLFVPLLDHQETYFSTKQEEARVKAKDISVYYPTEDPRDEILPWINQKLEDIQLSIQKNKPRQKKISLV